MEKIYENILPVLSEEEYNTLLTVLTDSGDGDCSPEARKALVKKIEEKTIVRTKIK